MKVSFLTVKKCLLILVVALPCILFAKPAYEVVYKTDEFRFDDSYINQLVNTTLKIENGSVEYQDVITYVYSKNNGAERYLIVDLILPNVYGITSYRLDLLGSEVSKIRKDYIEEEPLDPEYCGTCPDPETRLLITYVNDNPNATKKAVKASEDAAKAKNYKYTSLHESNSQFKTKVVDYLSCPKLVFWLRIGHGYTNGTIKFGDRGRGETLSKSEFSRAPFKPIIKDKLFFFNSCEVGGRRCGFGDAMVKNGAKYFHGGDDVVLGFNTSEKSSQLFTVDVIKGEEVFATFNKHMPHNRRDIWRAIGTGPIFPFEEQTFVNNLTHKALEKSSFVITKNLDRVTFYAKSGNLGIYNAFGKLLFKDQISTSKYIWDMKNYNGSLVNNGTYIAVLNNGVNSVTKNFTIVK